MSKTAAIDKKTCTKCPEGNNIKPITEFYVCKNGKIRPSCKKCDNAMSRAYKAKNKQKISAYNHEYKEEHCDEISVYNHEYNKNNREVIQNRQTKTRRNRRENDLNFYVATDLRTKLCNFIKSAGVDEMMEIIIGCKYYEFKKWFIYLFDEEMSFENYGEYWTVDHVYPCSKYDLTIMKNVYECFNWRNLRPMIKLKNSCKTNKISNDELDNHEILIKEFWNTLSESKKQKYI